MSFCQLLRDQHKRAFILHIFQVGLNLSPHMIDELPDDTLSSLEKHWDKSIYAQYSRAGEGELTGASSSSEPRGFQRRPTELCILLADQERAVMEQQYKVYSAIHCLKAYVGEIVGTSYVSIALQDGRSRAGAELEAALDFPSETSES